MTPRRWLLLIAVCGAAVFALSFVNAWVVHDRELSGEGFRHVEHWLSAWRGEGIPVLSLGALAAILTAGWAAGLLARPTTRSRPLLLGSVVTLGVILAAAWPVSQDSHASSVDLSAGPLLPLVALLGAAMLAGAVAVARPPGRLLAALAAAGVVVVAVGVAGRWYGLQASEGTGRHWTEGSYTRVATEDQPTQTLSIGEGTFAIGERWSGTWEWSGWTVVVDEDPACPDARGTYHAHGVGDEDLRFVKVVDTCADGARAADLETGTWERDP